MDGEQEREPSCDRGFPKCRLGGSCTASKYARLFLLSDDGATYILVHDTFLMTTECPTAAKQEMLVFQFSVRAQACTNVHYWGCLCVWMVNKCRLFAI